ncbi:MAG: HIT family protein [Tannerella sp.]|jgi:histidine triad (HIT) family protein|nr:HIT family protein [Tannerella sp.]
MASIFSKIVAGEIPSYKILENDEFFAFLDINPVTRGHTLVIPKKETDYIFDIDDDVLGRMMIFAKKIAAAIKEVIPCTRIGVTVMGLEVPHAHIHLIPINREADMFFCNPKLKLSPEEFASTAEKIRSLLQ